MQATLEGAPASKVPFKEVRARRDLNPRLRGS